MQWIEDGYIISFYTPSAVKSDLNGKTLLRLCAKSAICTEGLSSRICPAAGRLCMKY